MNHSLLSFNRVSPPDLRTGRKGDKADHLHTNAKAMPVNIFFLINTVLFFITFNTGHVTLYHINLHHLKHTILKGEPEGR